MADYAGKDPKKAKAFEQGYKDFSGSTDTTGDQTGSTDHVGLAKSMLSDAASGIMDMASDAATALGAKKKKMQ